MANVFLFFKRPKPTQIIRTIGAELTPMILDATLKENFQATAEAAKHPVEKGADITDHVILRPKTLSVSGIISETPLGDFPSSLVRAGGATIGSKLGSGLGKFGNVAGTVGGVASAAVGGAVAKSLAASIFGSKDRVLGSISAELVKVRDARQPVKIQTGLQVYENYIMTSVSVSRDEKTGRAIRVDMEFQEMLVAESQVTLAAIPKVASALNKTNQGRQTLGGLDSSQSARGASILKNIFGGA